MSLESLLGGLVITGFSAVTDSASTYLCARKFGTKGESNLRARRGMERQGIAKFLLKDTLRTGQGMILYGSAFFVVDMVVGIDRNTYNLHNVYLSAYGFYKYLASASNFFTWLGMRRLATITGFPVREFLRLTSPITGEKYELPKT